MNRKGLLITGAFGYIGSAILETLAKEPKFAEFREKDIYIFDRLQRQPGFFVYRKAKESLPNLKFILGDIRDLTNGIKQRLEDAVRNSERIIHLCASTQQPFSTDNEPIIYEGTKRLLEMVKEINPSCRRIVNMSTTNTYGYFEGDSTVCTEDTEPDPVNTYAKSKIKAEKICRDYWERFKLPVISLRMSTNFGYADGIRSDFFLNNMIWNALYARSVSVSGRRDNWRPFVHVKDAADAILLVLLAPDKFNGRLYNVGSEKLNLKLEDIVEQIKSTIQIYRKELPEFVFDADRDDSIRGESYRVDFSRFRNDFSFEPKVSLTEGIEELAQKLTDNCIGAFF